MVGQRLERYFNEWMYIKTILKGNDLRELGIEEGRHYATILDELKLAKIDGLANTRADEERLVKLYWERMKWSGHKRENF
jgi:tRNA nucleotidyltransferase (CCA-adding enzyme)